MAITGAGRCSWAAANNESPCTSNGDGPVSLPCADLRLLFGRPFDRDADAVTNPPLVAVLSPGSGRGRFASDPAIVGRAIVLNGQSFTVTAVAAPGFTGLDARCVGSWVPLAAWGT
jgi:hypothetical protein